MSPEPWKEDRLYIGYAIEGQCSSQIVLPPEKRENRAWILAKVSSVTVPKRRVNAKLTQKFHTFAFSTIVTFDRSKRGSASLDDLCHVLLSPD